MECKYIQTCVRTASVAFSKRTKKKNKNKQNCIDIPPHRVAKINGNFNVRKKINKNSQLLCRQRLLGCDGGDGSVQVGITDWLNWIGFSAFGGGYGVSRLSVYPRCWESKSYKGIELHACRVSLLPPFPRLFFVAIVDGFVRVAARRKDFVNVMRGAERSERE